MSYIREAFLRLIGWKGIFDGKKTIAGIVVTLIPILFPDVQQVQVDALGQTLDLVMRNAGLLLTAYGAFHKALKALWDVASKVANLESRLVDLEQREFESRLKGKN